MKFFLLRAATDGERHRHHTWRLVEASKDPGFAVLHEAADRLGSVDDLESVHRRGKRGHHPRLGHWHLYLAKLHKWMPARQQPLSVVIGDRARRGDVHIATDEDGAHRR